MMLVVSFYCARCDKQVDSVEISKDKSGCGTRVTLQCHGEKTTTPYPSSFDEASIVLDQRVFEPKAA